MYTIYLNHAHGIFLHSFYMQITFIAKENKYVFSETTKPQLYLLYYAALDGGHLQRFTHRLKPQ